MIRIHPHQYCNQATKGSCAFSRLLTPGTRATSMYRTRVRRNTNADKLTVANNESEAWDQHCETELLETCRHLSSTKQR